MTYKFGCNTLSGYFGNKVTRAAPSVSRDNSRAETDTKSDLSVMNSVGGYDVFCQTWYNLIHNVIN
jgi:hypothetical protein